MNYATMSHEQLVSELLGPMRRRQPRVEDRTAEAGEGYDPRKDQDPLLRHRLSTARELLMRELRQQMTKQSVLESPNAIREWLKLRCAGEEREIFLGLFLDAQHRLIGYETLFLGTLTQTSVYPREVVKAALLRNAAAMAVAHNHPSGSSEPSRADEFLTQTLKTALHLVDVRLLDHLVVGGDQIVSLAERGLV